MKKLKFLILMVLFISAAAFSQYISSPYQGEVILIQSGSAINIKYDDKALGAPSPGAPGRNYCYNIYLNGVIQSGGGTFNSPFSLPSLTAGNYTVTIEYCIRASSSDPWFIFDSDSKNFTVVGPLTISASPNPASAGKLLTFISSCPGFNGTVNWEIRYDENYPWVLQSGSLHSYGVIANYGFIFARACIYFGGETIYSNELEVEVK
jgi:hypothetical protein